MKTKLSILLLSILALLFTWSCEDDLALPDSEDIEMRGKGGNGNGGNNGGGNNGGGGGITVTMQDLGTFPGGTESSAHGINIVNNDIWVVGYANTGQDLSPNFAFLWKESTGTMQDLGWLHKPRSLANDVNSSGTIVGTTGNPDNNWDNAVMWDSTGNIFDIGQQLPFDSANLHSGARAINNNGAIVGWVVPDYDWRYHIWKWPLEDLGNLEGQYAGANGINQSGVMVGYAELPRDSTFFGFLYRAVWMPDGTASSLDTIPGLGETYSWANDINDAGQIVGYFNIDTSCNSCEIRGFIWENGILNILPDWDGRTHANAISEAGYVAGESRYSSSVYHAFLWRSDVGMIDLAELSGMKGTNSSYAEDIIDHPTDPKTVYVVGRVCTKRNYCVPHAVLWTVTFP